MVMSRWLRYRYSHSSWTTKKARVFVLWCIDENTRRDQHPGPAPFCSFRLILLHDQSDEHSSFASDLEALADMSDSWTNLLAWLEGKGFDRSSLAVELRDSPDAGGTHTAAI